MNDQVNLFIEQARAKGLSDAAIKNRLQEAGWQAADIDVAFGADDGLVVPKPPTATAGGIVAETANSASPISVVENLTSRGFEYRIFSVSLILTLFALVFIANVLVGGTNSWSYNAFPLTTMIVTGPIALVLFLRLKRAEFEQPSLKRDASRRKVLQAVQLITFLAVIGHTIALLYLIVSGHYSASGGYTDPSYGYQAGGSPPSLWQGILRWLVTVLVAGGTFVYYWRDEHKHGI